MGILMETSKVNSGTATTSSGKNYTAKPKLFGAMGTPGDYYTDTFHAIAINTRETEFGSIVEPIPITLTAYKQFHTQEHAIEGYGCPAQQMVTAVPSPMPLAKADGPSASKKERIGPPPKKKWIREYLEEEPKSPVSVRVVTGLPVNPRSNGVVRLPSPGPVAAPAPHSLPLLDSVVAPAAPLLDYVQEHSRPCTINNSNGQPQIPSPPSVGSSGSGSGGSAPRAGTREVHNKLEKNRRAHLKECFELLKRQLPSTPDDKKTSNLSILGSAIRYIQVLRRKERECEHEMERLAREKIAAQQRLAALKREVSIRATARPRSIEPTLEEKERDERVNGQVLGIPLSITSSPPRSVARLEASPPHTLNLSTKLRTLPIQIQPTTSQVVRTSYGSRSSTLTLTTLAPAESSMQNCQPIENGVNNGISTTLVHPAQIHLSQVVGSGGLVVGPAALQLLSAGGGLRVLQAPVHTNGVTPGDNRISHENGILSPTPSSSEGGSVMVSGLTPIVVSQPGAHLLHTQTLTHKMVETQIMKGNGVSPLTVSAQYLSATTIVKPMVVVSSSHSPPRHS